MSKSTKKEPTKKVTKKATPVKKRASKKSAVKKVPKPELDHQELPGEKWKEFKIDRTGYIDNHKLEVSNLGRVRTFHKYSNGKIIHGSTINGYPVIRLSMFRPREEKIQKRLDYHKNQIILLARKLRLLETSGAGKRIIKETNELLLDLRQKLSAKFKADMNERKVYRHFLIHRMVAKCFLDKPKAKEIFLAHLDFDKLNNAAYNLKWMTREENYAHRVNSPLVIEEMRLRKTVGKTSSRSTKLSVPQVMLLKKLLNEGKPMKQLVRQFKITDTQIHRIRRGENWGEVPPAK